MPLQQLRLSPIGDIYVENASAKYNMHAIEPVVGRLSATNGKEKLMSVRDKLRLFAIASLVTPFASPAQADTAAVQETSTAAPVRPATLALKLFNAVGAVQTGIASFYHHSLHGLKTASGEPYNQDAMTAAHPTLPIGTAVRVTNRNNKRWVIVRINDRGPNFGSRILDLSRAAAIELGMLRRGVAPVQVEVLALAN